MRMKKCEMELLDGQHFWVAHLWIHLHSCLAAAAFKKLQLFPCAALLNG